MPNGNRGRVCRPCADRLTELEVRWILAVDRGVRRAREAA